MQTITSSTVGAVLGGAPAVGGAVCCRHCGRAANERTFLAWNRTALALVAAGLGAAQFLHFNDHGLRLLIALPLIVLGAALSLLSYREWVRNERAMRVGDQLGYSLLPRVLVGGIALIAAVGALLAILDRLRIV